MDEWTKIQSGSIYYALNKLEKEGLVKIIREERIKGKIRRVYGITDKGEENLEELLLSEFDKSIYPIGSDKFLAYPFFESVKQSCLQKRVEEHMNKLENELDRIEKWQELKVNSASLAITQVSFEMMVSSLKYQLKWHQALLDDLDRCVEESKEVSHLIRETDFTEMKEIPLMLETESSIDLQNIKASILKNPNEAEFILSELIKKVKK